LILEETRSEYQAQLRHFEGLDAKAGILLGFSGAVVALAPTDDLVLAAGRLAAVLSGQLSLLAFWPRKFEVLDLFVLRQKYLAAEPRFTKLALVDTEIAMIRSRRDLLDLKARRLKLAMAALALAVLLVALGLGVH
jgi:hypothetical protein